MAEHPLLDQFLTTCQHAQLIPPGIRLIAAISGGVDSLVMLHLLQRLQKTLDFKLHVATLDHRLRGEESAADADMVEALAQEWNVPCVRGNVDVLELAIQHELNIEAAARQARYTFLFQMAVRIGADRIALAHHYGDQAETILMHLIRGSGLRGLRGMSYSTPLSESHLLQEWSEWIETDDDPADFTLIRPLLDIPRGLIEDYATVHQLSPRQDATNNDLTRLRNAIRHELLPAMEKLNPNIMRTLNRLALVVQGDMEVIDGRVENVAAWILEWTETTPGNDGDEPGEVVFMDRSQFAEQPVGIQRGLLRKIIDELSPGVRDVSFDLVERARHLILQGQTGAQCELPDDVTLRVGYDEVTIGYGGDPVYPAHLPALKPGQQALIDPEGPPFEVGNLKLMTYWVVEGRSKNLHPAGPLECTLAIPDGTQLALRTWQQGDRFKPLGMGGKSQKLSDTFTNLKVPAFYRQKVPLLTVNGEIAWIVAPTANGPQSRIAEPFAVREDSTSVLRLRWQD